MDFSAGLRNTIALFGMACAVLGSAGAQAADTKLVELANCNTGCGTTLQSCTSGCCGILFCRKSCISTCDTNYDSCLETCALDAISTSAFFDTATLAGNGRTIRLGGPLECPENATADLDVTVTEANGALATGHARLACPAGGTTFTADAHTIGNNAFEPFGTAQACGTVRILAGDLGISAFQWCRDVTLVPERVELGD